MTVCVFVRIANVSFLLEIWRLFVNACMFSLYSDVIKDKFVHFDVHFEIDLTESSDEMNTKSRKKKHHSSGLDAIHLEGCRRGGSHNRDLQAPGRSWLPGDEWLLPSIYLLHSSSRSQSVCLCLRDGQGRRVVERKD